MTITVDQIHAILRGAGFFGRVESIDSLPGGMLNYIFKVSISCMSTPLIIRVRHFQHPEYGQEFAAERFAYPLLAGRAVAVPALLAVDLDGRACGMPSAIFNYIAGTTLDMFLEDIAERQCNKVVLQSLASSLAQIHEVVAPGFGSLKTISFEPSEIVSFWASLFDREHARLININTELSEIFCASAAEWLEFMASLPEPYKSPCLVHGDIHGRNIIVDSSNTPVIIDWEASRLRISPYDFAQIRYCNFRGKRHWMDWLLDAYLEARTERIARAEFVRAIDICEAYWRLRMALFQRDYPFGESPYFGTAEEHLDAVRFFLRIGR